MFVRVLLRTRRVRVAGTAAVVACLLLLLYENARETAVSQQSLGVVDSPPSDRRDHDEATGEGVSRPSAHHAVTMRELKGGTGNQLFMFASLYGIARRNGRSAVMAGIGCRRLRNYFPHIRVNCADSEEAGVERAERAYATYDPALETLPPGNTVLTGYFQSWKYFQQYASEVREQLAFQPRFLRKATEFIRSVPRKSCDQCGPTTFVGVHVRRGDRVESPYFRKLYNVVGAGYLRKAMDYFRRRYPDVHFVVCSDSMEWCKTTLRGQDDVTFSPPTNAGTDLALLSLCNHTVLTVGTFGWWSAWLAGGTVIYYRDHLNVSTPLYTHLTVEDYFLPGWIPMTD